MAQQYQGGRRRSIPAVVPPALSSAAPFRNAPVFEDSEESDEEEHTTPAIELFNDAWDALDEESTDSMAWSTVVILLRLFGLSEERISTICPEEVLADKSTQCIRVGISLRRMREELEVLHPSLRPDAKKRIKLKEEELLKLQEDMQLDIQLEKEGDDSVLALQEQMAKKLSQLGLVTRAEIRDKLFEIAERADGALSDEEDVYQLRKNDRGLEYQHESKLPICQEIFGVFDTDGDGVITREDLGLVLAALGERSTRVADGSVDEMIDTMLEQFDENGDGKISFVELAKYLGTDAGTSAAGKLQHHINALKDLFSLIDVDGDASFSLFELRDAMEMFEIEVDKDELLEEFERCGGSFDDMGEEQNNDLLCFVRMVVGKPCASMVKFVEGLRDCSELFSIFDDDGGGSISVTELSDTLTALFRRRPTQFEMKRLIDTVDDDGSGIIEFSEFVHMMYGTHTARSVVLTLTAIQKPLLEQHQLFRIFCTNSVSNFACREFGIIEFKKLMCCLAFPYTDDHLQKMMNEIDVGGEGTVDFGEFAKMMTGQIPSDEAKQEIERQFGDLRKLFDFFDEDKGGSIDLTELRVIVEGIGKNTTDEDFEELVKVVDYTGDGDVGFDEFVAMLAGDLTSTQVFMHVQIQEFRDAYKLFDVDGDQSVSRAEFERVMGLFGESSVEDAEMLLDLVDEDGDGEIDFIEFLSFMVSKNPILQRGLRAPIVSFREMFNMFDDDKGGTIDVEEFMIMIDSLGMEMSEEEVREMMFKGYPGAEELDFAMFVELVASARTTTGGGGVLNRISELQESFTMFDEDGSGALDAEEIQAVLRKLGQEVTIQEVNQIVAAVDGDGDGEIDFCEFIKLIAKQEPDEDTKKHEKELERPSHERIQDMLTRPVGEDDQVKRLDEATAESLLTLLRENLNVKFFQDISDTVGISLCSQMTIVALKPAEQVLWAKRRPLYKQSKTMTEFNILLSGRVHVFDGASGPKEPTPYQLDRHRSNALWCQLGPMMWDLCKRFRGATVEMPVEDDTYKFTGSTKQMLQDLAYLAKDVFGWHAAGKNLMKSDVDTALSSEGLIEQGTDIYRAFLVLRPVLDQVRKGHIALRTKVQLMTAGGCAKLAADDNGDDGMAKIEVVIKISKDLLAKISEAINQMQPCFAPFDVKRSAFDDDDEKTLDTEALREMERNHGRHIATLKEGHCFGEASFATGKETAWPVTLFSMFAGNLTGDDLKGKVVLARATRQQWQQALLEGPFSFLSSLHIFQNLFMAEIKEIASVMEEMDVPLHHAIQKIGEVAEKVFFVKSGTLKVMQSIPGQAHQQRRRKSLALVGSGDLINECTDGLDDDCLYSAEVIADSKNVVVYSMPRNVFLSNSRIQENAVLLTSWRDELREKHLVKSSRLCLPVFDANNPRPARLAKLQATTPPTSPPAAQSISPAIIRERENIQFEIDRSRPATSHSGMRSSVVLSPPAGSRPSTSMSSTRPVSMSPSSRPSTSMSSTRPSSMSPSSRPSTSHSSMRSPSLTLGGGGGSSSPSRRPSTSHGSTRGMMSTGNSSPGGWMTSSPRSLFDATAKRGRGIRERDRHEIARSTAPRSHDAKNLSFEYVGGKDRLDAIGNLMARERSRCSSGVAGLSQHSAVKSEHGVTAPANTQAKFSYNRVSRPCSVMQPPTHKGPAKVAKVYTIERPTRKSTLSRLPPPPTIYSFEVNNQTLCDLRPTRKHGFV